MYVSAVRHGAVRGNGVFSGRNVQFGLTHPEKPAYSRMIMEKLSRDLQGTAAGKYASHLCAAPVHENTAFRG